MNLSGVLEIIADLSAYRELISNLRDGQTRGPLGLPTGVRPPVLARIFSEIQRPTLLITGRVDAVPTWLQLLEAWLPTGSEMVRFPEPTPLPYERGPWSDLSRHRRLSVFARLMEYQHPLLPDQQTPFLIVASARALLQKTLPRRRFVAATRLMRVGQTIDLEKLVADWQAAGYVQVSVVETGGQFSRRGGILDIFPVGAFSPIRIELFGDQVETLRGFDPTTQRSNATINSTENHVVIPPAREMMPGDATQIGRDLESLLQPVDDELPGWQDDVPSLIGGKPSPNLEYYLPMVYSQPASLLDYLPDQSLVVIDDMAVLTAAAHEVMAHADQVATGQKDLPPEYPHPLHEWAKIVDRLEKMSALDLGEHEDGQPDIENELADSFLPGPRYGGQVRPFLMQLRSAGVKGETTVVVSQQAPRLAELWREDSGRSRLDMDDGVPVVESMTSLPKPGSINFVLGSLAGGFTLEPAAEHRSRSSGQGTGGVLNLLTDAEIFGWQRPVPRRRSRPRPVAPETFFADIAPGDYVVHLEFGIGRFTGLVTRTISGVNREYLQVKYANGDILYVPVHHADRLSKWIGPDDRLPRMHRLGQQNWQRARAKAQESVDLLAEELLDLYASRETIAGHAFALDGHWQAELEASFPYRETEDQLNALGEVKGDMERPYPMDRLICGDVGYGKTEISLRAAFKAVIDGKQVAMLVPTTVLAQQHYNTFRQRLSPFPVNVEMLSRFRTAHHQERIVKQMREGQVDIVIGTHRLLSDDVSFKDLGLLIIDEEQRFGVAHKEKLKQLRTEVDVLTLTATPIPRTMYMSLAGVRDISLIDTAPAERLPVQTYVGESDNGLLRRAILRELDRGGQVFYVHNRVQTIGNAYVNLTHLVPEASVAIGHGQMSERELEDVMVRFVNGEIDVLLSTTIIESGLDIPNANTLIVERADRFGLSQLYQLRGRVGRGARRANVYLLHPPWHRLTNDAKARLEVIGEQTELGAGYTIAMRDLEIRGAGDLLGSRQSGHIAAVGFDLYTRLLAKAVKQRKAARAGEKLSLEPLEAVLIDLPLAAYVPTDYVPEASLRLRLYRRMAVLESLPEVDEMAAELADRFGPIPDPVDNLFYQLRVKLLARKAGVSAVTTEAGQVHVRYAENGDIGRLSLQRYLEMPVRVSRKGIWLGRDLTTRQWQVLLVQILERLELLQESKKSLQTQTKE